MPLCVACGQDNPEVARFCLACGSSLAQEPVAADERRIVTVIFVDLVGFTARAEQLDPEDVRALLAPSMRASARSSSATAARSRSSSATR